MTSQKYRMRPWLWFAISLATFIAIGCMHWTNMKGGNALFAASVFSSLFEVVSGRAPLGWLWILLPWLAGWVLVAGTLGWCLHGVALLVFSGHGQSKK